MNHSSKTWILSICLWLGALNPSYAAMPTDPKVLHVLNRLSFGPRPGDVQKVEALGVDRYIQQQLAPDTLPESQRLIQQLAQLSTIDLTPAEIWKSYRPTRAQKGEKLTLEQRKANQAKSRQVTQQAVQAHLLRAIESQHQLQEVMVNFWYNHFNVFAGKGLDRLWVGAYEQEAIRPHAIGRFRDLLGATARHPAMLFYLDNWQNTAPDSPGARGRLKGLNENYARELMELHTLGVDGGYSQQDVVTLAKIFTGWGFRNSRAQSDDGYNFFFDPKRHDFSDKVFLGQPIKGSGLAEGEQALDILAKSPITARHISYELAQYFVTDQPPNALVDRLAQRFLSTDGDLRAVLDTLFHSAEFWDSRYYNAKFKTPYEYAISAVRATGAEVTNVVPINGVLQQLGMPLYGCQTPDGYKNTEAAWLNPDAMTRRISFATALASGQLPLAVALVSREETLGAAGTNSLQEPAAQEVSSSGNKKSREMRRATRDRQARNGQRQNARGSEIEADRLAETLGNRFSAKTDQVLAASPAQLRAALILGSPEFMRR